MNKVNIVLFEPEIPQNTANIIRTCVGIDAKLHLIKPYGFNLNLADKVFARCSANYISLVELAEYENWEDFEKRNPQTQNYNFITRYGKDIYPNMNIPKDNDQPVYIIFGRESRGIDKAILEKYKNQTYRLPTSKNVRSLNLSNCVMTVSFEVLRQLDFAGLETEEPHKYGYLD